MKESDLRKWHRNLGILFALFIILQAGSGLLLTIRHFSVPHSHAYGDNPGHLEIEEAEKPVLHEHSAHEATPRNVESHEPEKTNHHESHAHEQSSGHAESHEAEKSIGTAFIEGFHHGGGGIGAAYRLLVGFAMLGMAISGGMIFFKVQARTKKS